MQVVFLKRARADVERLRRFLEPHGENLGQRVVSTLLTAAASLEAFPERGRPSAQSGTRELVVPFGRGAYIIRYRIQHERNVVIVTRIWHGREHRS